MTAETKLFNKKGLFFHLIMFGILLAFGIFLVVTKSYTVQQEPVGLWHLNFIANTLQPAEIDLLELDQKARDAGWDAALLLAKQGGFSEKSECGQAAGRNIWNDGQKNNGNTKGDKWCLPVVKEVASRLVGAKVSQKEIAFTEEMMRGIGENKVINVQGNVQRNTIQRYEYLTNIAIDLDYSFDEYAQLEQEARSLVKKCRDFSGDSSELLKCVNKDKQTHWQLCEEGVINVEGNDIGIFCVKSPGNYAIKGKPVVYELGLKFGESVLIS